MNYYYIDYMIKQRQLMEIEACERRRLLKAAGYADSGLLNRVLKKLIDTVPREKGRLRWRTLPFQLFTLNSPARKTGEGI